MSDVAWNASNQPQQGSCDAAEVMNEWEMTVGNITLVVYTCTYIHVLQCTCHMYTLLGIHIVQKRDSRTLLHGYIVYRILLGKNFIQQIRMIL